MLQASCQAEQDEWLRAIERKLRTTIYPGSLKEGTLMKEGGSFKSWRQRFFVLYPQNLCYFKKAGDKLVQGEIPLAGAVVAEEPATASQSFMFSVMPLQSKRKYLMSSPDDSSRQDWISALRQAISTPQ